MLWRGWWAKALLLMWHLYTRIQESSLIPTLTAWECSLLILWNQSGVTRGLPVHYWQGFCASLLRADRILAVESENQGSVTSEKWCQASVSLEVNWGREGREAPTSQGCLNEMMMTVEGLWAVLMWCNVIIEYIAQIHEDLEQRWANYGLGAKSSPSPDFVSSWE